MRIAFLWTQLAGYTNACLKALAATGAELFVSHARPNQVAPFAEDQFAWLPDRYCYDGPYPDSNALLARLEAFEPDLLLVGSWHVPPYRRACRRYRRRARRVMFMDNPWRNSLRQRLGVAVAPWLIRPLADAVFLPGERQESFARKLGFRGGSIARGGYSCDHALFARVHRERQATGRPLPETFLFVGRLMPDKGISTLAAAYRAYRSSVDRPWPLHVCGAGPMADALRGIDGIVMQGFVQPDDLPRAFADAGCLLLPSLFEPWGVVIHEATAAGLPVICSTACGASVELVQDDHNGYRVDPGDIGGLAAALQRFAGAHDAERRRMSLSSYAMSARYTPELWAVALRRSAEELLRARTHP